MNLQRLERLAKKSTHRNYQHCSLIYAGSRLLAFGYNHDFLHSEQVAIRMLLNLHRNDRGRSRNLHIVNFMLKRKNGNIGNSRPCDSCMELLLGAGIEKMTFFENGEIRQIYV